MICLCTENPLDRSHHLSSSCVCPHEPVLPFPRRGMLMETSWLPDYILKGVLVGRGGGVANHHPIPSFSLNIQWKHRSWGYSVTAGCCCCCVNWSCVLALLMENPHVRVDCSSPDAWGLVEAGHELFWASLTFVATLTICRPRLLTL